MAKDAAGRAVDEVSEDAGPKGRAEAEALIADAEGRRRGRAAKSAKEVLAGPGRAAKRPWTPSTRKPRKKLDAETGQLACWTPTRSGSGLSRPMPIREADHYREQARRGGWDEASQRRIKRPWEATDGRVTATLEAVSGHPLRFGIPGTNGSAGGEAAASVMPLDRKFRHVVGPPVFSRRRADPQP